MQQPDVRDRLLAQGGPVRGSGIRIADVDAFVIFQRLREIDVLFDGILTTRYRLSRVAGRVSNGWLDCPDFLVERRNPAFRPASVRPRGA
jgi:hypothetical protein